MKRIADIWGQRFLVAELVLGIACAVIFAIWFRSPDGTKAVGRTLIGVRPALYGVLSTLWGALLGFEIATVAIVLGFSNNERLTLVKGSTHYPTLWATFLSAMRWAAAATVAAVVGLLLDHDPPGNPSRLATEIVVLTSLMASLRLARAIWLLQRLVRLVVGQSEPAAEGG